MVISDYKAEETKFQPSVNLFDFRVKVSGGEEEVEAVVSSECTFH